MPGSNCNLLLIIKINPDALSRCDPDLIYQSPLGHSHDSQLVVRC